MNSIKDSSKDSSRHSYRDSSGSFYRFLPGILAEHPTGIFPGIPPGGPTVIGVAEFIQVLLQELLQNYFQGFLQELLQRFLQGFLLKFLRGYPQGFILKLFQGFLKDI